MPLVVVIDVGILNLGMVVATVTEEWEVKEVQSAHRIDITICKHSSVARKDCKLYHTRDAVDRVAHFIQDYCEVLGDADHLLIERQPPGGLVHIEQLLYAAFRDKGVLVSPNRMHHHFRLSSDYDQRKKETVLIAEPYLKHLAAWTELADRRHDISDAACLMLSWLHQKRKVYLAEEMRKEAMEKTLIIDTEPVSVSNYLESFRYRPPVK